MYILFNGVRNSFALFDVGVLIRRTAKVLYAVWMFDRFVNVTDSLEDFFLNMCKYVYQYLTGMIFLSFFQELVLIDVLSKRENTF